MTSSLGIHQQLSISLYIERLPANLIDNLYKKSNIIKNSSRKYLYKVDDANTPAVFFFFFYESGAPRDLHSSPTRRSSDLPRSGRDRPRHRLSHAAVDGRRRHRAQGRLRRGALALRAVVPPPAPFPSDLHDLPLLVREIGRAHV